MRITQLSGIFLATVMLCGSIPLGFSEPLRVQLEQGMEINEIQCDNPDNVLVYRTNGKLACVSERTAEKLNWEIINNSEISNVALEDWTAKYREMTTFDYEFPITGDQLNLGSSESEASLFSTWANISIDGLPAMGETANVTLTVGYGDKLYGVENWITEEQYDNRSMSIFIPTQFEVLSISDGTLETTHEGSSASMPVDYIYGEEYTITVTIKTVKEGIGKISGYGLEKSYPIEFGVAPTETLLQKDFVAKYPNLMPQRSEPQHSDPPEFGKHPDLQVTITTITEERLRWMLESLDWTEQEILDEIKRTFPDEEISTQSFFLPSAFASSHDIVRGTFAMENSPLSHDVLQGIHGAKVCLYERIRIIDTQLDCQYTSQTGVFFFQNIVPQTESVLFLEFSSDGEYADVRQGGGTNAGDVGDVYSTVYTIPNDMEFTDEITLNIGNLNAQNNPNQFRVFWIIDAISDAVDYVKEEFSLRTIPAVTVGWQFDGLSDVFAGNASPGAKVSTFGNGVQVLYLDGRDTDTTGQMATNQRDRPDDSFQRHTIIHEWGHHLMNWYYTENGGNTPQGDCNPNNTRFPNQSTSHHQLHLPSSKACAWREGFSNTLPFLVDANQSTAPYAFQVGSLLDIENAQVIRTANPNNPIPFTDLENNVRVGQEVEGRVAAAIWDILDTNVDDPRDTLDEDDSTIGNIYTQRPNNIEDLYNTWQADYVTGDSSKDSTSIMNMHFMDFVTTPTSTPTAHRPSSVFNVGASSLTEPLSVPIRLTGTSSNLGNVDFYLVTLPTKGTLSHTSLSTPFARDTISADITYIPNVGQTGDDSFTFMVRDGTVNSAPATVNISIQSTLTPTLTSNAGNNQVVTSGSTVRLDGSGSTNGVTYQWSHTSIRPSGFTFSSTLENPTFTAPTVASSSNIILSLIVTKDGVSSNSDTVTITVNPKVIENTKPRADAGTSQQAVAGNSVTLDGSRTSDADGDSLTYFWEQIDTTGYSVSLSNDGVIKPTFTAPPVTSYTELKFLLTVTEQTSNAQVDDDNVRVYISPVSTSRTADSVINHPSPTTHYAKFGGLVNVNNDKIIISEDTVWVRNINTEPISSDNEPNESDEQPQFEPVNLVFNGTSVEFPDGTIYKITSESNDELTLGAEPFGNNSNSTLPELIKVVDEENNLISLVNAESSEELAFIALYGYVYLYDLDDINSPTASLIGASNYESFSKFAEAAITFVGTTDVAISNPKHTTFNPRILESGLIHLYENPSSLGVDSTGLISNPEASNRDLFGTEMTALGTEQLVISGSSMDKIYLFSKDGTELRGYPNPTGASTFNPNAIESFGDDRFVAADDTNSFIFNTSSSVPELTINHSGNVVATNSDMNWVLLGESNTVKLIDELGNLLLDITLPNSDVVSDVTFAKNKIVVGSADSSPNGISRAGTVYILSPIDGSLLETIQNDGYRGKFGAQVEGISYDNSIAISAPGFDGVGEYDDVGRVLFYDNLNHTPIATANANLNEAFAGDTIQLEGIGIDADGDSLTYSWTQHNRLSYPAVFDDNTLSSPSVTIHGDTPEGALEFSLVVNDGIIDSLADTASITILASDVRTPPILSSISDVTINEGDTKSFAASATDDNNDTITYSLSNSPDWVTISGVTITVSAPSELSDTSYSGTVTATDNDGSDTDTFTINITEVNQIPSLGLIDDINSEANQIISFTITASDSDIPAQSLSFSITGNPTGAVMDDTTGLFTWTPTESQVGIHTITFTVTDNGSPIHSDSENVTFTITEIPDTTPPTITVPDDKIYEATAINTILTESQIGTATATDDRGNNSIITDDRPDSFPLGDTTITYTATDGSNNVSTKSQVITITDTTPPLITAPADITQDEGVTITLGVPITSDIFPVTITNNATDSFPVGFTTIRHTATDSNGNSAFADQRVVIEEIPDIILQTFVTITTTNSTVNNDSFTINGTANNVYEVALYKDGMYTGDYTNPDDSGNWSFDVTLDEGQNVFSVNVTNGPDMSADSYVMIMSSDVVITLEIPVMNDILFHDTFDSSLNGWEKYSFIGGAVKEISTFDNYTLSIDNATGNPLPSAAISGDGLPAKAGMQKTVDISSISNSPLYLSFDYRAKSDIAALIATNANLGIYDGVTGKQIHYEQLIIREVSDSGWQRFNADISGMVSGHDTITIRLFLTDSWSGNVNQQNWYDNITLGTQLDSTITHVYYPVGEPFSLTCDDKTGYDITKNGIKDKGDDIWFVERYPDATNNYDVGTIEIITNNVVEEFFHVCEYTITDGTDTIEERHRFFIV